MKDSVRIFKKLSSFNETQALEQLIYYNNYKIFNSTKYNLKTILTSLIIYIRVYLKDYSQGLDYIFTIIVSEHTNSL